MSIDEARKKFESSIRNSSGYYSSATLHQQLAMAAQTYVSILEAHLGMQKTAVEGEKDTDEDT